MKNLTLRNRLSAFEAIAGNRQTSRTDRLFDRIKRSFARIRYGRHRVIENYGPNPMPKRIGRPSLRFDEETAKTGPIRQINLPREGSALEGVYAEYAAKSDLATAPYEAIHRENFNRSVVFWTVAAVFWLGVLYLLTAPGT